jgi:hypothetical protein
MARRLSSFDRLSVAVDAPHDRLRPAAHLDAVIRVRNSARRPYAGVMEAAREVLEEFLRRARPLPRAEFVQELEESLLRSLVSLDGPCRSSGGGASRSVASSGRVSVARPSSRPDVRPAVADRSVPERRGRSPVGDRGAQLPQGTRADLVDVGLGEPHEARNLGDRVVAQ